MSVKQLIWSVRDNLSQLRKLARGAFSSRSYSQEGEDLFLRRFFDGRNSGFYIDVGAHHPVRFSNTYWFYKKGWKGINIEPNSQYRHLFHLLRRRDIYIQMGVSETEGTLTYYMFDEPALNSFDKELVDLRVRENHSNLVKEVTVPTRPLRDILQTHCVDPGNIDFMTIDVEGFDLQVLKSNDWEKYRPQVLAVELLQTSMQEIFEHPICIFLQDKGYEMFGKLFNTAFFRRCC